MAEILSDGVRSVTSDDTSARDYSHMGHGYGYGGVDWPERTAERVRGAMSDKAQWDNEMVRDLLAAQGRGELATEKTGAASILQVQLASAGLGVQAEKIGAATNLAIEKTAAATALAIEKTAAASQLLAVQNAGAAALTAATNTATVQAAIAACCCELKELVRSENGATRDLINGNRIRELELQLASIPRGVAVTIPPAL